MVTSKQAAFRSPYKALFIHKGDTEVNGDTVQAGGVEGGWGRWSGSRASWTGLRNERD